MLTWNLECVTGTCDTEGAWKPASVSSGVLTGTGSHLFFLLVTREMTFSRGEPALQVPEGWRLYLSTRGPPAVQVEPIS